MQDSQAYSKNKSALRNANANEGIEGTVVKHYRKRLRNKNREVIERKKKARM